MGFEFMCLTRCIVAEHHRDLGADFVERSPGCPSGNFDWYKEFELVVDAPVSNCGAIDDQFDDTMLGVPSLPIVTVSVVAKWMLYGPSHCSDVFE